MELEFELEETDLVTLAKHQLAHSPAIVKRYRLQRYGLLAIFGVLALVSYFILHKPAVALYSGALALFCFGLYPFYYRWITTRTLRGIVSARLNPAVFARRTLRLSTDGLDQISNDKHTVTPWSRIGDVTVTAQHAFIAVDGVYALAIPRGRVKEERFQRFVAALRAGQSGMTAAST